MIDRVGSRYANSLLITHSLCHPGWRLQLARNSPSTDDRTVPITPVPYLCIRQSEPNTTRRVCQRDITQTSATLDTSVQGVLPENRYHCT